MGTLILLLRLHNFTVTVRNVEQLYIYCAVNVPFFKILASGFLCKVTNQVKLFYLFQACKLPALGVLLMWYCFQVRHFVWGPE